MINTSRGDQPVQTALLIGDALDDLVEAGDVADVGLVIGELCVQLVLCALGDGEEF